MTRARKELIALETTPYYHCISRCVRRAFLWGSDSLTGKDYSHRKTWVIERLRELVEVFTIDICAYAVMSNHYHLVLRVDQVRAAELSDREVIERWSRLFKLPMPVARRFQGEAQSEAEIRLVAEIVDQWRVRLIDISWLMRCLNEHLARRANEEDGCRGRFWEGRFKVQALLDEAAVLTCMSYVDLNPVRAALADTPETSDFTSIQQRIRDYTKSGEEKADVVGSGPSVRLMPLNSARQDPHPNALGFTERDYLELIDWSGRAIRAHKRGAIPSSAPPILTRLGLDADRYLALMVGQARIEVPVVLGRYERIKEMAEGLGRRFIKGLGEAKRLYRCAIPA